MRRREVLRWGALGLLCNASMGRATAWSSALEKHVLVLGGTGFLGPATVQSLVDRGYTVTLFNRGQSNPDLFPHLEKLRGNRDPKLQNLSALQGTRQWDAVIDVWPQEPAIVEATARLLAPRTNYFLYVSSVAAYDGYPKPGMEETAPLRPWDAANPDYGHNKAESERRLEAIVGPKLTVVRPGPIMGTRSGAPDFVTWLMRARSGGKHIGPGDGSDAVEIVDVHDVGSFLAESVDRRRLGAWNLTGKPMTFRNFLEQCKSITASAAEFVWVPQPFLSSHGLKTDKELDVYAGNFPFWRPEPDLGNIFRVSSAKAYGVGWTTRPLAETARLAGELRPAKVRFAGMEGLHEPGEGAGGPSGLVVCQWPPLRRRTAYLPKRNPATPPAGKVPEQTTLKRTPAVPSGSMPASDRRTAAMAAYKPTVTPATIHAR